MVTFLQTCKSNWNYRLRNLTYVYKWPHYNHCVPYMEFKWRLKDSLCYSELIYVSFKLNKAILPELLTLFYPLQDRDYIMIEYYKHLEKHKLQVTHISSNFVAQFKNSPCSSEWIDVCYKCMYKNINCMCGMFHRGDWYTGMSLKTQLK